MNLIGNLEPIVILLFAVLYCLPVVSHAAVTAVPRGALALINFSDNPAQRE